MEYVYVICFSVWAISIVLSVVVMFKKNIEPSFWSVLAVLCPIVNTLIVIVYFRPNLKGFNEFWKELNEKGE